MPDTLPALTARKSLTVDASIAHAFAVFTTGFDGWWPRAHHIGKADLLAAVIEPHAGGRWYEKGVDGSECDWGTVLWSSNTATSSAPWAPNSCAPAWTRPAAGPDCWRCLPRA
jgi:hypothetical protein